MFNFMKKSKNLTGFTLVELLIVIGIIAILASLAFVALNPLARFQDSRNAQRWTDVNAIISAIKLNQIDNKGVYLGDIEDLTVGTNYLIGKLDDGSVITCSNPTVELNEECLDLDQMVDDGYMSSVPFDPKASGASSENTYYYLSKSSTGVLTIGSCSEELGSNSSIPDISISR